MQKKCEEDNISFDQETVYSSNTDNIINENKKNRKKNLLSWSEGSFIMNTEENQQQWIEKCIQIMKMGGKSNSTITNYKCGWRKLFNYYSKEIDISQQTEEDLLKFFKEEIIDKKMSRTSYNNYLCAIRFLYSVCFRKDLNRTILPNPKLKKRIPTIISKEEFIRVFNLETDIRHKCWLILSFCCGLRSSEIALLKIEYIDSKNHRLKVLGKGNKERFTILPDIVIKYLRIYYRSEKFIKRRGFLFKGLKNRTRINTRTVSNYFGIIKTRYGITKDITEHSLRHSFATYYLMNGGDLITLKEMLGHTSIKTTCIYVHIAQDFNNLKGIKYDR